MSKMSSKRPLYPDRHPQQDFFVCDIFDAVPKGDQAAMEHPVFSISTKPDHRIRYYENGNNWIKITPSFEKGLATVHDRDVLIFCISQIMQALNEGQEVSQTVRFKAHDLLVATNRPTGGEAYERLKSTFERLRGTMIVTNIKTGDEEVTKGFGLIESFEIVRESWEGRMQEVEIKLSDWVFNAIEANEVLTLHRDYFRLRKPLERRIYEIARKHCGRKDQWSISLNKLRLKCGSNSPMYEFRRLVRAIVQQDIEHAHIPDYALSLDDDMLTFTNRHTMPPALSDVPDEIADIKLDPETYHDARTVAEGWDVYYLEREWKDWITEKPRNPDEAFIAFCRKWVQKRGAA